MILKHRANKFGWEKDDLIYDVKKEQLEEGGPGSGSWNGPGDPRFAWSGMGRGEIRVGITSFIKKGVTSVASVKKAMDEFKGKMIELKGVSKLKIIFGTGIYIGENERQIHEPTWVVSYKGNGKALELIQATAKQHNQESVLLCREKKSGNNHFAGEFELPKQIDKKDMRRIDKFIEQKKLGCTWYKLGSTWRLRFISVHQWGGNDKKIEGQINVLKRYLGHIKVSRKLTKYRVSTGVMKASNNYKEE